MPETVRFWHFFAKIVSALGSLEPTKAEICC